MLSKLRQVLFVVMLTYYSRAFSFLSRGTVRSSIIQCLRTRTSSRFVSSISSSDMAHNTDMSSSIGSASGNTIDPEEFLFGGTEERLSFAQMEVHPGLVTALAGIEKETATNIQRKSFAPIVAGKDTVIGAETGSGKTLSYMIPILHKLITTSDGESADAMTSTDSSAVNESGEEDKGDLLVKYGGDNVENYPRAIILVPNKELAMQVEDMVRPLLLTLEEAGIKDARGNSIEVQAMTATEDSWPYRGRGNVCPQIMICTPLFIGKFCKGGSNILEPDLFERVSTLVMDEADMLLDGSYLDTITKVLEAFRLTRRSQVRRQVVGMNEKTTQFILSAATIPNYGMKSLDRFVQKKFPEAVRVTNDYLHKHHPQITQTFHPVDCTPSQEYGEETVENEQKSGDIFTPSRLAQLEACIVENEQTMIFVNTASIARELSIKLRAHDFIAVEFHKNVPLVVKGRGLEMFKQGQIPILICTDAAARGLDLSNVRHVIQAQFALNVVQYLHRIGRASRAGRVGKATSFYDDDVEDLVTIIRSSGENASEMNLNDEEDGEGQATLKGAFSRNRSFRTKIKKLRRASSPREK